MTFVINAKNTQMSDVFILRSATAAMLSGLGIFRGIGLILHHNKQNGIWPLRMLCGYVSARTGARADTYWVCRKRTGCRCIRSVLPWKTGMYDTCI